MPDWQTLFEPSVPLAETFARGTVIFLAVFVLMRLIGQREAGALGITDVLLVVLVAEATAVGLHGDADSLSDAVVLVATILFWSLVLDAVSYRWPRLGRVLKARARPLIEDGELNRKVMRRELMTEEEVRAQMRLHGVTDVQTVARAYIEPNGMISLIRRDGEETEPVEPPESDR